MQTIFIFPNNALKRLIKWSRFIGSLPLALYVILTRNAYAIAMDRPLRTACIISSNQTMRSILCSTFIRVEGGAWPVLRFTGKNDDS